MTPALAVALGAPVARKYSSPGGGNERVWTHGYGVRMFGSGSQVGGIEKRRKISWKKGGGV